MALAANQGPVSTPTPENAVVLLIGHQRGPGRVGARPESGRVQEGGDGAGAHRQTLGIPVIITTSRDFGPNGMLPPELRGLFPDVPVIRRTGTINACRWPEFRAALEAAGRRHVIVAGVSSTTCLQFPCRDMAADGCTVHAVIDASGSESRIAREMAIATLAAPGVDVRTRFSVAAELVADWRRDEARGLAAGCWGRP